MSDGWLFIAAGLVASVFLIVDVVGYRRTGFSMFTPPWATQLQVALATVNAMNEYRRKKRDLKARSSGPSA